MLDRTKAPQAGRFSDLNIQKASLQYLASGIPVHVISSGQHDIVRVEIISKAGKWQETGNGVSLFTSKMLLEGTTNRSSLEIAEFFEFYGAHVSAMSSMEFMNLTIYSMKEHLGKILKYLNGCFLNASFPENELITLKQIQKDQIKIQNEKNDYKASKSFKAGLFGSNHPYGSSLEIEDIDTHITRDTVYNFYKDAFMNRIEIIISGNVGPAELKALDHLTGLVSKDSRDEYRVVKPQGENRILVEDEKSVQTSIRYGALTLPKTDPDSHGLSFVNQLLGGFFGSRLMKNIREDKGYTYGIYSNIVNLLYESYLIIGADVKKEFREATVDEINLEINKLRTELVSNDELETVKNYLLGTFLSDMETSFSLADKFKGIYFFGLEYDYYDQYVHTINNITSKQVRELAARYLNPEEFRLVMVG